jgi:transcriptional regulator with XRE-family HTH domain
MESCQDPNLLQSHDSGIKNTILVVRKTLMPKISFGEWLEEQLKAQKMRPVDLVRASGLDSGVVSNLINNRRNPGIDSCKAIAQALKLPITEVMTAAGIIPERPDGNPIIESTTNVMSSLSKEDQLEILQYAKLRLQLAQDKADHHARNPKRVPKGYAPS